MIHTLATTPSADGSAASSLSVLVWAAALVCLVIGGGLGVMWFRRRLFQRPASSPDQVLEDMRGLRDRGLLTPEEFNAVRRAGIDRIKNAQIGAPDSAPDSGQRSGRRETRRG